MPATALIVLGVAFVIYCACLAHWNSRAFAKQRDVFSTRDRDEPNEWFARHFANTGLPIDTLSLLLGPIAQAMRCDITQLRPTDSFSDTLAFKGVAFLGCIDDDNPLHDYFPHEIARVTGGMDKVAAILPLVQEEPTLKNLAIAAARHWG